MNFLWYIFYWFVYLLPINSFISSTSISPFVKKYGLYIWTVSTSTTHAISAQQIYDNMWSFEPHIWACEVPIVFVFRSGDVAAVFVSLSHLTRIFFTSYWRCFEVDGIPGTDLMGSRLRKLFMVEGNFKSHRRLLSLPGIDFLDQKQIQTFLHPCWCLYRYNEYVILIGSFVTPVVCQFT